MQPNNQPMFQGPVMPPQPGVPMGQVPVQLPKDKPPFGLIIGLVITVLLLIGAVIFGFWAFASMQDYKNNSDKKAAAAVVVANEEQKKQLDAQYAEQEKSPLKSYTSPSQFGSVKLVYPKTWSAYVVEQTSGSNPVDAYFYPDFVPNTGGKNNYYMRMQISSAPYKAEVDKFKSLAQQGKVTVTPFKPEQVKDATVGVRIDGQLESDKKGSLVILPVRDKVLKIWTESDAAANDYNVVLKNLTYSP